MPDAMPLASLSPILEVVPLLLARLLAYLIAFLCLPVWLLLEACDSKGATHQETAPQHSAAAAAETDVRTACCAKQGTPTDVQAEIHTCSDAAYSAGQQKLPAAAASAAQHGVTDKAQGQHTFAAVTSGAARADRTTLPAPIAAALERSAQGQVSPSDADALNSAAGLGGATRCSRSPGRATAAAAAGAADAGQHYNGADDLACPTSADALQLCVAVPLPLPPPQHTHSSQQQRPSGDVAAAGAPGLEHNGCPGDDGGTDSAACVGSSCRAGGAGEPADASAAPAAAAQPSLLTAQLHGSTCCGSGNDGTSRPAAAGSNQAGPVSSTGEALDCTSLRRHHSSAGANAATPPVASEPAPQPCSLPRKVPTTDSAASCSSSTHSACCSPLFSCSSSSGGGGGSASGATAAPAPLPSPADSPLARRVAQQRDERGFPLSPGLLELLAKEGWGCGDPAAPAPLAPAASAPASLAAAADSAAAMQQQQQQQGESAGRTKQLLAGQPQWLQPGVPCWVGLQLRSVSQQLPQQRGPAAASHLRHSSSLGGCRAGSQAAAVKPLVQQVHPGAQQQPLQR